MKLRHAAALALVGWYLMMPPIKGLPDCARIDSNAPLLRWEHIASFDNAQACQEQLRYDVGHATKVLYPPDCNAVHVSAMQAYGETCIASDDPRFKGE